jgi:hypothetical protein
MNRLIASVASSALLVGGLILAAPPAVAAPSISPSTQSISGTVGTDLSTATLSEDGFAGNVKPMYTISTIPPGLVFEGTSGQLHGIPTTAGRWTLTIQAARLAPYESATATIDLDITAPQPPPQLTACTLAFSGTTGTATWTATNGSPDSASFIGPQRTESLPGTATSTTFDMSAQGNGHKTYWVEGLVGGTSTGRTPCDGDYTGPLAPPTVTLGEIKTNNTKRQQWLNIAWSAPAIGWRSPTMSGYDATLSFATGIWVACGFTGDFISVGQGIPESAPFRVTAPCASATATLTLTPLGATTVQGEFTIIPDFSVVRDLKYWTLIDGHPGPFVNLAASATDKKATFVISNLPPGKAVTVLSMVGFYEAPYLLDPKASITTPAAATVQLTYNPTGTTGAYAKTGYAGAPFTLTPTITPTGKATTGYAAATGALPPGVTLNPTTGVISGTPTGAWTGIVTVTVTMTDNSTASQQITFTVGAAPAGSALSYQNVTVLSGSPFSVAPNARPQGQTFAAATAPTAPFSVTAAGVVGGTAPTVTTTTFFKVTVTAASPADTATFTVTVKPLPGVSPSGVSPAATSGASGGTGSSAGSTGSGGGSSGSAGSGLSSSPCLAPDGAMYADLAGSVGSTLTMAPNLAGLRPATNFSIIDGSLPEGIWLDSTAGVISGTPRVSNGGRGPVTVQTTFVDGSVRQTAFNIAVDDPHHAINYPNRTIGSVGQEVVVAPLDVHTHGKRTYRIVCGTLLPGLKFNSGIGELSGTPTAIMERPVPLRVRMTDDYGWVDASFLIVVNQGVTPWVRYPDLTQLDAKSATIIDPTRSALPGSTRYTISGRLPKGLTFDRTTGAIYGTPTVANARLFHPTVRAHDKRGKVVVSAQLTVTVTKSAVPMKVTARAASKHLARGKNVLVTKVLHPPFSALTAKVTCKGCTHTFNRKTGKIVVHTTKRTTTVTVRIAARPTGATARRDYTVHTWTRTWRARA